MSEHTNSPYPFEPFLAMTPVEVGDLFSAIGISMRGHLHGAPSTVRAGNALPAAPHIVDLHMLARMGAKGLWQLVDVKALSEESQSFIEEFDAACEEYSALLREALQWWNDYVHAPANGDVPARDINKAFKKRYNSIGWGSGTTPDTAGYAIALKWYIGAVDDEPEYHADITSIAQAGTYTDPDIVARIHKLEAVIPKLASKLASPDCPLKQEPTISLIPIEGGEPIVVEVSPPIALTALYCLNHVAMGLNDSRHHHPGLIPALKMHSAEGSNSVHKLAFVEAPIMASCRMEDFRAMLNPSDKAADTNVFSQTKTTALFKLQQAPRTAEGGFDPSLLFADDLPVSAASLDWLILGKAMDETADVPEFLQPLYAYMEGLRGESPGAGLE
jgi:hypothetical protein